MSAVKTVGAALCPKSGVEVVRGFVGFVASKLFEAGQMAVGFAGKRFGCSKWLLWAAVR